MVGLLNDAMLGLMTSVGHRTGLFDTMATLPPSTSAEVAEAAGLDERYVREWLNAHDRRPLRRLRPERPTTYVAAARARRVADPGRRPREHGQHGAVHRR